eukprot:CAMPEP_0114989792 /NCGR_PEP_ID=MMETSP0216-20121206/10399_1 /TAXON_ID=223996 /ORGANISM="Protocruzia adherens, Strain Boccale" /LENGTH=725 /DNA_ID=CAMNT_0002352819 /DNA_START=190 /DNA_END=2363 /DNA_ORIENTATION=+
MTTNLTTLKTRIMKTSSVTKASNQVKKENEELKKSLKSANDEIVKLKSVGQENQQKAVQSAGFRKQFEFQQQEIAKLQNENSQMRTHLQGAAEMSQALRGLQELQKENDQLKEEHEQFIENARRMEAVLQQKDATLTERNKEIAHLRKQLEEKQKLLEKTHLDAQSAKTANQNELKRHYDNYQGQIESLHNESQRFRAENSTLQQQMAKIQKEYGMFRRRSEMESQNYKSQRTSFSVGKVKALMQEIYDLKAQLRKIGELVRQQAYVTRDAVQHTYRNEGTRRHTDKVVSAAVAVANEKKVKESRPTSPNPNGRNFSLTPQPVQNGGGSAGMSRQAPTSPSAGASGNSFKEEKLKAKIKRKDDELIQKVNEITRLDHKLTAAESKAEREKSKRKQMETALESLGIHCATSKDGNIKVIAPRAADDMQRGEGSSGNSLGHDAQAVIKALRESSEEFEKRLVSTLRAHIDTSMAKLDSSLSRPILDPTGSSALLASSMDPGQEDGTYFPESPEGENDNLNIKINLKRAMLDTQAESKSSRSQATGSSTSAKGSGKSKSSKSMSDPKWGDSDDIIEPPERKTTKRRRSKKVLDSDSRHHDASPNKHSGNPIHKKLNQILEGIDEAVGSGSGERPQKKKASSKKPKLFEGSVHESSLQGSGRSSGAAGESNKTRTSSQGQTNDRDPSRNSNSTSGSKRSAEQSISKAVANDNDFKQPSNIKREAGSSNG